MCLFSVIAFFFFFSSRRRHTRFDCDWSSDVCSSGLLWIAGRYGIAPTLGTSNGALLVQRDRKSTRLNSSHSQISYAVFCLKKKTAEHSVQSPHRTPLLVHCVLSGRSPAIVAGVSPSP